MVWICKKGRGGVFGEVGEMRVGGHWLVGRPLRKKYLVSV